MTTLNELFLAALSNTPAGHFSETLSQRNPGPESKGSIFDVEQDYWSLREAAKDVEPYDAGSTGMAICTYVKLPIPGKLGIVNLDLLPADAKLTLLDPKFTCGSPGGGVDAYYEVEKGTWDAVDFTVAIIGPGDAKDENGVALPVLWTFHPGHTVPRPTLVNDASLIGKIVTPAEAKALGLTITKLVVV